LFLIHCQVGHFNCTGKKWSGHHDTYRSDEIVELAADVGISPSFPIPEILSTHIATKESFGIIPILEKIAEELGFERRKEPLDEDTLKHRKNEREIYKSSDKHKLTSYSSSSY